MFLKKYVFEKKHLKMRIMKEKNFQPLAPKSRGA